MASDTATPSNNAPVQHPNEHPQDFPSSDALKQAAAHAEQAIAAQGMANKLRQAASSFTDPAKREKMLTDAYNKELEAHGSSKKARMLQSGAFQGTIGGAGIGGAVSAGLGTVVGTVVGTVTAIPATGLGALVGAGAGAIHGPWIKLGSLGNGGKDKDGKEGADAEKKDGGDAEQKPEEVNPDDEDAVPNPELLRQAADLAAEKERETKGQEGGSGEAKQAKKKPRKIEIRSGSGTPKASS